MKNRLDSLLVKKGLVEGRNQAKELISNGKVQVDGLIVTKPSENVCESSEIKILGNVLKYVSRGGLKLEKALEVFSVKLENKLCMDIGASTGGFTDCMIQNGASKVYAVDVGTNQLAEKLRKMPKVISLENTNIRYIDTSIIEKLDFISIDVSFISLELVLPTARELLKPTGEIICLIKPQFEVGAENIGKNGVVKSQSAHIKAIEKIVMATKKLSLYSLGLDFSPIKGPKGNIEYLLYLSSIQAKEKDICIKNIVYWSHNIWHCKVKMKE